MATGIVKWLSAGRGCGFTVPDGGGTPLFVDYCEIVRADHKMLVENMKVRFDHAEGGYGLEATHVTFSSS